VQKEKKKEEEKGEDKFVLIVPVKPNGYANR
jgi:hypothetical protein